MLRSGADDSATHWSHRLYLGDNLEVLRSLREEFAAGIDFITIDPPFNTGTVRRRGRPPEAVASESAAYRDAWGGGWRGYLEMLEPRLALMRELLAPTGLLVVHVDYRAHPRVRLLLDGMFGGELLVNDIVWSYRSGGGSKRRFGFKHDNLLVYARTKNWHFNADAMRVPYDAVIAEKRRAAFHPAGKVAGDVWDIPRPPNHAKEWTGYPTQKPEALLERQIVAFSPPGGLVADFFCGSGTAGVVAERLGRRWIMADSSPQAIEVAMRRLEMARAKQTESCAIAVFCHGDTEARRGNPLKDG